eukprot:1989659-Prymnesium_polylepis.1
MLAVARFDAPLPLLAIAVALAPPFFARRTFPPLLAMQRGTMPHGRVYATATCPMPMSIAMPMPMPHPHARARA